MNEVNKNFKEFIIVKARWRGGQVNILPQALAV
jgi:hypothetical protein